MGQFFYFLSRISAQLADFFVYLFLFLTHVLLFGCGLLPMG